MFDTKNFDAKRLLDQFLTPQAGGTPPAVTGQTQPHPQSWHSAPAPQAAGGDLMAKAKEFLGGQGGSMASGAAAGALVSLMMGNKTMRKLGGNAVALGGLALVGTLAYKAYQNYSQGNAPAQASTPIQPAQLPPPESPFNPAQTAATQLPVTLLRTMIAASLADGHIDDAERAAISAKLNERPGASRDEAERFLAQELANPASVETIARAVASPEEAAEVYIAALLAIDPDVSSERAFLARLALALKLDAALTPHLEAAARAAKQG